MSKILDEPYRFFFPVGVVLCLFGMLYWPLKIMGIGFAGTPTEFHKHLLLFGFMHSFVVGFLTTAVPRLTQAGALSLVEFVFLVSVHTFLYAGIFVGKYDFTYFDFALAVLSLLIILGRRFARRKRNPPESFVFMPAAFVCALGGSLLLSFLHFEWITWRVAELYVIGLKLVNEGYLLCLVLGVGGFLLRSLFGVAPPLLQNTAQGREQIMMPAFKRQKLISLAFAALLIVVSYPLEHFLPAIYPEHAMLFSMLLASLRAAIVTSIVFGQIGVHRNIGSSRPVEIFLRLSLISILIGLWVRALFSTTSFDMTVEHLVLALGFGMAAVSVATRVVLSHGGRAELLQKFSWQLFMILFIIFVGGLTRVIVFFMPQAMAHHLGYAASLWALGIFLWALFVTKNTLRR